MLTDPGDIGKAFGAIDKIHDAKDKLCAVRLSEFVSVGDRAAIVTIINQLAAATMHLSTMLPEPPE